MGVGVGGVGRQHRVAITGMGAICGLGHHLEDVWANGIRGVSGVSPIEYTAVENLAVQFAGEVKDFQLSEDILSAREQPRFDRFIHFALHAAHEALDHAGLKDFSKEDMGCILGVGIGGFGFIEKNYDIFKDRGPKRVSPFFIPGVIPNMASGMVSISLGLKGINYTISSACASGGHAIGAAFEEVANGHHKVVLTGGVESALTPLAITGFNNMKALSKHSEDPTKASRPFDVRRDGFVIGEGAGLLVLEEWEHARHRGATLYAEVKGHGATSDAFHISAPHEEGEGAARCMELALESAGIVKEQVGYINAHGTSTPLGDIAETRAIKKAFGPWAPKLRISSTKSMTGHLLGGAGGLETIFCVMALHHGQIPPTINLEECDPECDLDYVANKAQALQVEYALNNSFGFGGANSSIVLQKVSHV